MTSSTGVQAALEAYLFATMATLCGSKSTISDGDRDGCRQIEELRLFDIDTPFARVADVLGSGLTGSPQVIEEAPESVRVSVEHRYALARWPLFEFRILESQSGLAWGQMFVRRTGILPPTLVTVTELRAWSHVESEVQAALGPPVSSEEWSPWKSVTYRAGDREYVLCYVYGLVQQIQVIERSTT